MLVVSRKIKEGFWIDDRTFVKVLDIGGKCVKLGIDAPQEVVIKREEIGRRGPVRGIRPDEEPREPTPLRRRFS